MKRLFLALFLAIAMMVGAPIAASAQPGMSFAAHGDSNTSGHAKTLENGMNLGLSWAATTRDSGYAFAGGVAIDGYTSVGVANRTKPVSADVNVIMVGTNDIRRGYWTPTKRSKTFNAIMTIVKRSGVPRSRTIIMMIAPNDRTPALTKKYNAWLMGFQSNYGMTVLDPWSDMRASSGGWLPGFAKDGVHGTPSTYQIVGSRVAEHLASRP